MRLRILITVCTITFGLFSPDAFSETKKILYHIHHTTPNSYLHTISILENLKKAMPGHELEIRILLQGESIQLLNPKLHSAQLNRRFLKLLEQGSKVEVSRDNYERIANKDELILQPLLVPGIFNRIIQLQQQGYSYITP